MNAPRTLLHLRFAARAASLAGVRNAVREALEGDGCAEECARDVVMAVDEACQNVIRHAYGGDCEERIELDIERGDEGLLLRVRDYAPPIDPSRVQPRPLEDLRPGGLGVHFIREVMDDTHFEPCSGGGNLLVMTKRLERR